MPTLLLRERVARELKTTFASNYTRTISMSELLDPSIVAGYAKRATGENTSSILRKSDRRHLQALKSTAGLRQPYTPPLTVCGGILRVIRLRSERHPGRE